MHDPATEEMTPQAVDERLGEIGILWPRHPIDQRMPRVFFSRELRVLAIEIFWLRRLVRQRALLASLHAGRSKIGRRLAKALAAHSREKSSEAVIILLAEPLVGMMVTPRAL